MINIPLVVFVKIGITGHSAKRRAAGLNRSVPGLPIPIFFCVVPGAYHVEQWLHRLCSGLSVRYYSGDGGSEWFWILAAIPALGLMAAIWVLEFWAFGQLYNYLT